MTEVLMGAMNEFMEDTGKKFGILDLSDAVQAIASKSERTDFFLLDEKINHSFAWSIVVDTSTSMRNVRDYTLEIAIILAESAGKILPDMTSWSIFAFNDRFESAFAEYVGTRHAIALPSCTSAIHLSLAALGIGLGDEVITPDITWIASAAPISYVGATPVFADIDPETWCLCPRATEALVTERTAAIMGHTPMNRFGEAEELAGAVVWLASAQASGFVTGAIIRVDGGFTAMTI